MHSLRGGSAPGYDSITASFLKYRINALAKPLIHIINTSLLSGEYSEAFKIAKGIPIYKSNKMSEKSNFHPISLFSLFTKVLEKIVKEPKRISFPPLPTINSIRTDMSLVISQ